MTLRIGKRSLPVVRVLVETRSLVRPGEWRDKRSRFAACIDDGRSSARAHRVHAGCERHTIVGARTLIMAGAHAGHDAQIGVECNIAPNAVIGGCNDR